MNQAWIDTFTREKNLGPLEQDFRRGLKVFLTESRKLPDYRKNPSFMVKMQKEGTDFATEADMLMQRNLKESLLTEQHSDMQYGFWGEEKPDNTIEWQAYDRVWVSDPIEGTINYKGERDRDAEGEWGSVLSLVDARTNTPLIGFVIDPISRELYFAVKGQGAYRVLLEENWENGQLTQIMPEEKDTITKTIAFNRSDHFPDDLRKQSVDFENHMKSNGVAVEDPESGTLEVVRVEKYDGAICFRTSEEMAAAMLFIEEAGGKATDFQGNGWKPGIRS
ncbi:MAG: inositol monophosphatase family protein, partial [Candidatus Levybacteria bacterium]|nr:inositol monophosphatase family protein [Candidatus Levybacteria bacterium]